MVECHKIILSENFSIKNLRKKLKSYISSIKYNIFSYNFHTLTQIFFRFEYSLHKRNELPQLILRQF